MIGAYLATLESGYAPVTASVGGLASATCTYTPSNATCSTSEDVTCTVGGGSGSVTYLWEIVSGTASFSGTETVNPATLQDGPYNNSEVPEGSVSTFKCTVTDSVTGRVAITNTATFTSKHEFLD